VCVYVRRPREGSIRIRSPGRSGASTIINHLNVGSIIRGACVRACADQITMRESAGDDTHIRYYVRIVCAVRCDASRRRHGESEKRTKRIGWRKKSACNENLIDTGRRTVSNWRLNGITKATRRERSGGETTLPLARGGHGVRFSAADET